MSVRKRILIVDDSPFMQRMLNRILSENQEIEVVGFADNPFTARDQIIKLKPDLVTLDLELPKMNGLEFLEKLMTVSSIPVVVVSSAVTNKPDLVKKILDVGASFVFDKAKFNEVDSIQTFQKKIGQILCVQGPSKDMNVSLEPAIFLAASTGGPEAIKQFLDTVPHDIEVPATVIVQHMPRGFTALFAEGLNKKYSFEVKEANEGDKLKSGRVLIAPGDFHLEVILKNQDLVVALNQSAPLYSVRPAADILFLSVAKILRKKPFDCAGIVLTGMGRDGARGLAEMKKNGAYTLVQSLETCLVAGMPGEAIKLNAATAVTDIDSMYLKLSQFFTGPVKSKAAN